jgi:hypothetical protein
MEKKMGARMRLFAKISAGETKEYRNLRPDQIHHLVQKRFDILVEQGGLFDEIIVEEP